MKVLGVRILVLVSVVGLVATGIFVTVVQAGGSPPPGLSQGVHALDRPTPGTATNSGAREEPDVAGFVQFYAGQFRVTPASVLSALRMLSTDLGDQRQTIYGFKVGDAYCFLLTNSGGSCAARGGASSFAYTIGGGDGGDQPGALAGIVADDVVQVLLNVDGADVPVSVQNNAAYAQLPNGARHADVTVVHDGGKRTTSSIDLGT